MGAGRSSGSNKSNKEKTYLCSDGNGNAYFPPSKCVVEQKQDFFLQAGTIIDVKRCHSQLRRNWIGLGCEKIKTSKTAIVILDATVNDINEKQSSLYVIGRRVKQLCCLLSCQMTMIMPRIPIFVFPRHPDEAEDCKAVLLSTGLQVKDVFVADHPVKMEEISKSAMFERLIDRQVELIHIIDCSNYFEVPCDPLLLGFSMSHESDCTIKVVRRNKWNDKLPMYALKVEYGDDSRADVDEYSAILEVGHCDPAILQLSLEEFYLRRLNEDSKVPDSDSEDKRLAFGYSVLPSMLVHIKVLLDAKITSGNLMDHSQRAVAVLMPCDAVGDEFQDLEKYFKSNSHVRDDSLLKMLFSENPDLKGGYDETVDERLDYIKEYVTDRRKLSVTQNPKFYRTSVSREISGNRVTTASYPRTWRNIFACAMCETQHCERAKHLCVCEAEKHIPRSCGCGGMECSIPGLPRAEENESEQIIGEHYRFSSDEGFLLSSPAIVAPASIISTGSNDRYDAASRHRGAPCLLIPSETDRY